MSYDHKYFSLTTLILLLFIAANPIFTEVATAQNDPETKARELFDSGNYEQALPIFKDLVGLYPSDVKLNYYYAACLIENEQFGEETNTAIQLAIEDNSQPKIFYYQGQALHAHNNFQQAIEFYNRFLNQAKRKVSKETKVEALLKMCEEEVNPFPKPEPEVIQEVQDAIQPVIVEEAKPLEIPTGLKDSIIHFQVTTDIHYLKIGHFKNDSSIQSFVDGWVIEQKLKSILKQTNQLRDEYATVPESEKAALAEKILQLEKETYNLNIELNKQYQKARHNEISYWNNAASDEVSNFRRNIRILEDSIANASKVQYIENENVAIVLELPEEDLLDETEPVQQSELTGVVYKIQIGAYRNKPPQWVQNLFKKLSVIRKIDKYTDDKGITVYTVGELSSYNDAKQMRDQVRQEGVHDASIAAYKEGARISIKEARQITNE